MSRIKETSRPAALLPRRFASGSLRVRQAAAVGADRARRAGGRGDATGAADRDRLRALIAARAAGSGRRAAIGIGAAARAEEDAALARVAARLVLIAVVHQNLQPVGTPRRQRDVPARLGAVA